MSVYKKLNEARAKFHELKLAKTGRNTFANYNYFELGDFLIPALKVFKEVGLCAVVGFTDKYATMTIVNIEDPADRIVIESPMGSAALKGCHEVQNIGAVETYQRRYLWVAALEIVEHDALDATTGRKGAVNSNPQGPEDAAGRISPIAPSFRSSPTMGALDQLREEDPDAVLYIHTLASTVIKMVENGKVADAFQTIEKENFGDPHKPALWGLLPAPVRTALTKHRNSIQPQKEAA
jgi:hypothetical protein